MKEIKAYVRPELLETIVGRLEQAGAKDISVIRVDALGAMADWEESRSHPWQKYQETYSKIAKIEIVCHDGEAESLVRIIQEVGHLGESGDGRVFVGTIDMAVNIRTGSEGDDAL